jgi:DNA polymerase/3'-5' exonuclease PolX
MKNARATGSQETHTVQRANETESTGDGGDAIHAINGRAAALLEQIADELANEEPCPARRIAAYRKAAAGLRATSLRVDELWCEGHDIALARIPGVTSAIARVIGDLIATKHLPLPSPIRPADR